MPTDHTKTFRVGCGILGVSAITCLAQAQPVHFHAWFEGPSEVLAGETVTIEAWAEATGVELGNFARDLFTGVALDIQVTGDMGAFASISSARSGQAQMLFDAGIPDANTLRGVAVVQFEDPPGASEANPILLYRFDVATRDGVDGNLALVQRPPTGNWGGALRYQWSVDGTRVYSDDPGNTLTVDPFSFRVVPAPSCVGLGAIVPLAARRRRTRS